MSSSCTQASPIGGNTTPHHTMNGGTSVSMYRTSRQPDSGSIVKSTRKPTDHRMTMTTTNNRPTRRFVGSQYALDDETISDDDDEPSRRANEQSKQKKKKTVYFSHYNSSRRANNIDADESDNPRSRNRLLLAHEQGRREPFESRPDRRR